MSLLKFVKVEVYRPKVKTLPASPKNPCHMMKVYTDHALWGLNPLPQTLVISLCGQSLQAVTKLATSCCYFSVSDCLSGQTTLMSVSDFDWTNHPDECFWLFNWRNHPGECSWLFDWTNHLGECFWLTGQTTLVSVSVWLDKPPYWVFLFDWTNHSGECFWLFD